MVSSSSLGKSKDMDQAPYENFKIEVQFDRSPKRSFKDSNQHDRTDKGVPLGIHKRDPTRHQNAHNNHLKGTQMPSNEKVLL